MLRSVAGQQIRILFPFCFGVPQIEYRKSKKGGVRQKPDAVTEGLNILRERPILLTSGIRTCK
jgi:hypothetical protein